VGIILIVESTPLLAPLLHCSKPIRRLDLRLALQELHSKPSGDVERDMAVHEPRAGVVGLECEHEIAFGWETGGIATDWVIGLETREITVPNCVVLLVKDVEVVAVEMDGVR
jgi:hypothetical protein